MSNYTHPYVYISELIYVNKSGSEQSHIQSSMTWDKIFNDTNIISCGRTLTCYEGFGLSTDSKPVHVQL